MSLYVQSATPARTVANRYQQHKPMDNGTIHAGYLFGRLSVFVSCYDGQYVAVEQDSGMFGEGDTVAEAVSDLVSSLQGLRAELREHRGGLSMNMARQLEALENSLPAT